MNENTKQIMQECIDKLKNVYEYEKPKSIYEYSTMVPNNYLLPLIHAAEEIQEMNKQLEKEIADVNADYQDLGKQHLELLNKYEELEKIVEAMAYEISEEDENYQYLSTKEITEHFTKKVRGELKWGYIKP